MLQLDNYLEFLWACRQYAPIIYTVQLLHRNPQIFLAADKSSTPNAQSDRKFSTDDSLRTNPPAECFLQLALPFASLLYIKIEA